MVLNELINTLYYTNVKYDVIGLSVRTFHYIQPHFLNAFKYMKYYNTVRKFVRF